VEDLHVEQETVMRVLTIELGQHLAHLMQTMPSNWPWDVMRGLLPQVSWSVPWVHPSWLRWAVMGWSTVKWIVPYGRLA
jgi:hypothetical protein